MTKLKELPDLFNFSNNITHLTIFLKHSIILLLSYTRIFDVRDLGESWLEIGSFKNSVSILALLSK